MSVLVTGGLGFIGGYVTRDLLDAGYGVTVLARSKTPTPEIAYALRDHAGKFAVEVGSVEDLDGLVELFSRIRPEAGVRSASTVDIASLYRDPYLAFRSTAAGTDNVLESARRTGGARAGDSSTP